MAKFNFADSLNEQQARAVKTLDGPVLIIAGAGSGKTRVITYRMAYMLSQGISQSSILALTFTNKAAREMQGRIRELTGRKMQSLTVSTFHAFGVKVLREEIEALGFRRNFSIYDETDRNQLIKDSMRECRLYNEKADLYSIGRIFSGVKTGLWGWEERPDLEPVYREYQQSLAIYNALDFDDLLVLPIRIFNEYPETLEKYRQRFRYIMVDEFQDTSLVQYSLLRLLAGRNVCVVGDDDQSIYSWRGASYENVARFERDFPGVEEIKLEQNYRSTTTILEAANGLISHNTNRKEKRLWSGNGGGKTIDFFQPENESDEADFIAARIKELSLKDRLNYDDFGVLIRTNSLSRSIEEAFLAENIPYRISGGTSFYQRKEIKDIVSYLRIIANSYDDVNLLRIINTPRRGIGKTGIVRISELAKKNRSSLWEAMERLHYGQLPLTGDSGTPDAPRREKARAGDIDEFMNLINFFKADILGKSASGEITGGSGNAPGRSLSQKVKALVDNIDYWGYLTGEYSKNEKMARWKYRNIEYLLQSIENWEQDPDTLDPGLYAYLNRISLITKDTDDDDTFRGKVNLMTIHASKGLEFPVVFIAGAEAGIIPHERSIADGDGNIEEERRLFYVAITRARDKLYITSCRNRRKLQGADECSPSPFLSEIPPSLIEYHKTETFVEDPAEAADYFTMIKSRFS